MRNVLAVVTPHPRQEGVIEEAAGLLADGRGRLTVLCLWTPAPCWALAGHAGIPPLEMLTRSGCASPSTASDTHPQRRWHPRPRDATSGRRAELVQLVQRHERVAEPLPGVARP